MACKSSSIAWINKSNPILDSESCIYSLINLPCALLVFQTKLQHMHSAQSLVRKHLYISKIINTYYAYISDAISKI